MLIIMIIITGQPGPGEDQPVIVSSGSMKFEEDIFNTTKSRCFVFHHVAYNEEHLSFSCRFFVSAKCSFSSALEALLCDFG